MVWPAACCISHTAVWYTEGFFFTSILVSDDFGCVLSLLGGHTIATQKDLFRSVKTTAFIDSGGENRELKCFMTGGDLIRFVVKCLYKAVMTGWRA